MAWKRLTKDDLRLVLAEDEIQKLEQASIDLPNLSAIIQQQLDACSDTFRAAFIAKGYALDVRDHYIDDGYVIPALDYARYQIFTRFPMAESYALSKPREDLYKAALELLKNPYLGTSKPDYSDDPELSGNTDPSLAKDPSITIPWLRCPPLEGECGFPAVYWSTHRCCLSC